jgi:hypothetical protein
MRKIATGEPLEIGGEDLIVHTDSFMGMDLLGKLKNFLDNFQNMGYSNMGCCHGG